MLPSEPGFAEFWQAPKSISTSRQGREEPKQKINSLAELKKQSKTQTFSKNQTLDNRGSGLEEKIQPGPAVISRRVSFCNQHGKGNGSPSRGARGASVLQG